MRCIQIERFDIMVGAMSFGIYNSLMLLDTITDFDIGLLPVHDWPKVH